MTWDAWEDIVNHETAIARLETHIANRREIDDPESAEALLALRSLEYDSNELRAEIARLRAALVEHQRYNTSATILMPISTSLRIGR
jgi:uncharacterized tellurite resistance protein B-like protein